MTRQLRLRGYDGPIVSLLDCIIGGVLIISNWQTDMSCDTDRRRLNTCTATHTHQHCFYLRIYLFNYICVAEIQTDTRQHYYSWFFKLSPCFLDHMWSLIFWFVLATLQDNLPRFSINQTSSNMYAACQPQLPELYWYQVIHCMIRRFTISKHCTLQTPLRIFQNCSEGSSLVLIN